ncbi:sulfotransferase domain-containing protein [Thalassotalea mangrovi]|uniref:Sulfotransferase domain-containing protein n=1 Tax=Thalassotalea mangrovi TaxID=2572245 RepID=A0A4U1B9X8_9GAMM|nr:sulfotransferase domain-containing protein [Thalassotalea mangrovi]TKB46910.1 sulfotransferase domain-containing protein [Thalassotalea mangrovi]
MSKANRLVNFIIVGTQKGGTTALDFYLRQHPDITMANKKEVHFFDHDNRYHRWRNLAYYHSHFDFSDANKVIGEATPSYMYCEAAIKRIYQYNAKIKLIAILRNPVERAYSHWNMARLNKFESLPFRQAIAEERHRCQQLLPDICHRYSYTDRGFYSEQIRRLQRYFPDPQLLFLRHEWLKQSPAEALKSVTDFLNVSPFIEIEAKEVHSRPYANCLSDRDRQYLLELYELEIKQQEKLLNWDLGDWRKARPERKSM